MPPATLPPIAIIADAHFFDPFGDYGIAGVDIGGRAMAVRPFADTIKSTRVFNESAAALRHALKDIGARGIRHVVLLGDYSDDGQTATMGGLRALLEEYRQRHAIRFFATPGNHDIFGMGGRHRSKRFLNSDGGSDLVTSDPHRRVDREAERVVVTAGMRCLGYPDGLPALPDAGFFGSARDFHWETPFGANDDPAARLYEARSPDGTRRYRLVDASYLVEPVDGLWLLVIDANVFVPLDEASPDGEEALADSTDAGWNAMLRHKRFVLDWIRDVAARAKSLGKTLVAFSHYPALDPLDRTSADERAVLGRTGLLRRLPEPQVGTALIDAGIRLHFSGHLHVNDTARMTTKNGFLVNIAVPSLVAFPAAYKILRFEAGRMAVETIGIGSMPLDRGIVDLYRAEAERGRIEAAELFAAEDYGRFLSAHLGHLVGRRHLKREWPEALAAAARTLTLADLAGENLPEMPEIPVMIFLGDWYRVRMGSELGLEAISPQNLKAYRRLSDFYRQRNIAGSPIEAAFAGLFRMFDRYILGLPSRNFAIDMETGEMERR